MHEDQNNKVDPKKTTISQNSHIDLSNSDIPNEVRFAQNGEYFQRCERVFDIANVSKPSDINQRVFEESKIENFSFTHNVDSTIKPESEFAKSSTNIFSQFRNSQVKIQSSEISFAISPWSNYNDFDEI